MIISKNYNNISEKSFSNKVLYFLSIIIIILLIQRDLQEININKFIFLAITSIGICFLNKGDLVTFTAFLLPLSNGLPGNYIFLIICTAYIVKSNYKINLIALILLIIVLISEFRHINDTSLYYFIEVISYSIRIFFIINIVGDDNICINWVKPLKYFIYSTMSMGFIILVNTFQSIDFDMFVTLGHRLGSVELINYSDLILNNNANNIAYYCSIAVASTLLLILTKNINSFVGMIILLLTVIIGFFTISRTYILVITFTIIYSIFCSLKINKNSIRSIFLLIIMLIASVCIVMYVFPDIVDIFKGRFSSADIYGGRDSIIDMYLTFMYNNIYYFLFGTGVFDMMSITGYEHLPHSGLLQIFVAYGVVGMVVTLICFIYFLRKGGKVKVIYYMTLFIIILFTQSIQFLAPYELMMPIIVAYCSIKIGTNNKLGDSKK